MAKKTSFFNGITDLLILSILLSGDSYPYEMCKFIREHSDGFIAMSQNTLYTAIYKLLRDDMVSEKHVFADNKRARVYYHIEDLGVAYQKELLTNYKSMAKHVTSILSLLDCNIQEVDEHESEQDLHVTD